MRLGTRLIALLTITAVVGLACQVALGYWSGAGIAGGGAGGAGAATLNQGAAPTAGETGSANVVVRWGSSSLSNGIPADGYIVKRFDADTGQQAAIGGGCSGTVTATTCNEPQSPVGNWTYSVTPVFAGAWRGDEGLRSGAVNTGPGSMTLSRELFGGSVAPLPSALTASVSAFGASEPISVLLDGTALLSSSPSQVKPDGSAGVSITLPAGIADGPHSLQVVGNSAEASAGILVDNTSPTIAIALAPSPNAAGWNNTAPVEVGGTVDDGNGSGVASAKYTVDGSDPKTSPTTQYALAPLSLTASATVKFYLTDNAGNESPVETRVVKIDTVPPYFTVDFVDVEGGFYLQPTNEITNEPGTAYYRGADAGSVRFLITPIPLGGSPAVSAGFSELPPDSVGFSFDSSRVTTPLGGPFLSNTFSWVAGTTRPGGGAISLTNEAGNTFGASGQLQNDSTPPGGGSVQVAGASGTGGYYSTSLNLQIELAKGSDSASGLADGTVPTDLPSRLVRASAALTSDGVADGTCGTFSAFVQVGGDDPGPSVNDTVPTDNTCYLYRYLVPDHVGNVATYTSPIIKIHTTAAASLRPTNAVLTPTSGVSSQWVSGSTVFYNPAQLGSFDVETSTSAPYSGIAHVDFPSMSGFSGGGAITSPRSGTIFRATYAWSANAASPSPGIQPISATDNAGQTATNAAAFTVVRDGVGPSGGAVDATGLSGTGSRYSRSLSLSVAFAPGTDAGSGLAVAGAQLLRASAPLTSDGLANGTCGTFGAFTPVGVGDPATPASDTVPADRTCYRYQYLVSDKVGNQTGYMSADIKVDTAAPAAPALTFSGLTNAFWSGVGTAVFYRPGAASGGFQVSAGSTDTTAGIAGYGFPLFPSGWSSTAGGASSRTYSWSSANPTAPTGAQTVTATNNAGGTASSTFTVIPDAVAPSGGTVTHTNGYSTATTLSTTFTKGSDSISGLNAASGILEGATATLSAGICGTFGSFVLAATNPVSPLSLPVVTGNCYKARYLISDNVGNQATYTGASITKVDTVAPTNALSLTSAVNASMTSSTIYYRGNVAGSFKIVDAVADAASGPASATFPVMSTTGWVHNAETISTPLGGPYVSTDFSWTASPTLPTSKTVTGRDAAAKSTNTSVAFISDIVAPAGGSIAYTNGVVSGSSIPISVGNGTDTGSGINTSTVTIKRDSAPLLEGTCGEFPGTFPTTVTLIGGADTALVRGNCYRYQYIVSDKVGNLTVYGSASVAKY
ncbi:MAG: chitobiase/beta-hexosaminidase C-terminal domain-containing protein [Solirubrobacterales bacterium]